MNIKVDVKKSRDEILAMKKQLEYYQDNLDALKSTLKGAENFWHDRNLPFFMESITCDEKKITALNQHFSKRLETIELFLSSLVETVQKKVPGTIEKISYDEDSNRGALQEILQAEKNMSRALQIAKNEARKSRLSSQQRIQNLVEEIEVELGNIKEIESNTREIGQKILENVAVASTTIASMEVLKIENNQLHLSTEEVSVAVHPELLKVQQKEEFSGGGSFLDVAAVTIELPEVGDSFNGRGKMKSIELHQNESVEVLEDPVKLEQNPSLETTFQDNPFSSESSVEHLEAEETLWKDVIL